MATIQPFHLLQTAFTAGEISEEVANRVDLDKYQFALLKAENCLIKPYGPVYKRPGMKYIAPVKNADSACILVPFNSGQGFDYLLEIGPLYIRAYKYGEQMAEVATPFTADDLTELRFAQSADIMFITSGKYPVKQLARYSDTSWQFSDFTITHHYFDESLGNVGSVRSYNEPGTYTFTPTNTGNYTVIVAGAGGGGAGGGYIPGLLGRSVDGGNGGSGGLITKTLRLNSGQNYTVVVGAGGVGGATCDADSHLGYPGANGSQSSFDSYVSQGGEGGTCVSEGSGNGASHGAGGAGGAGGVGGYGSDKAKAGTNGKDGWVSILDDSTIKLTPSAKDGEITITATNDFFTENLVGGSLQIKQQMPSVTVKAQNDTSNVLTVGDQWKIISGGTWTGTLKIEKSVDGANWEEYRSYSSKDNYNVTETGTVTESTLLRAVCTVSSGTCIANLTALPYTHTGVVEITGYTDAQNVSAIVTKPLGNTDATDDFAISSWNNEYGYPKTSCFFQDRLCFGGSTKQPYMIWMSRTGDYGNFGVEKAGGNVTDDSAIAKALISRKQFGIKHLVASNDLLILTEGNEWSISGADVVTPGNCAPKTQDTRGCGDCEPLVIGGKIIFVQGRGSTVRDMGYSFETDSYGGNDLTLLAKQIIDGVQITDSAYKQEPDSVIYFVRSNGTIACLSYVMEQRVYAWSTIKTNGFIEAVSVVQEGDEDVVYVAVKRTINGSEVRNIEMLNNNPKSADPDEHVMLDSAAIFYNETATNTFSIPHLAGMTVDVVGDGRVLSNRVVEADGTLAVPAYVNYAVIGLPYTMSLELPNVEIRTGDGTMQGRYKQVSGGTIRLSNSLGGEVGLTFDTMDMIQYDEFLATDDIRLFNGDKKYTPPPCEFNFEGRVCLRSSDPYPFNVLMITRQVAFGG